MNTNCPACLWPRPEPVVIYYQSGVIATMSVRYVCDCGLKAPLVTGQDIGHEVRPDTAATTRERALQVWEHMCLVIANRRGLAPEQSRTREHVLHHFFQLTTAYDWEGLNTTERRRWVDRANGDLAVAFQLYRQDRYDIIAALPPGTKE